MFHWISTIDTPGIRVLLFNNNKYILLFIIIIIITIIIIIIIIRAANTNLRVFLLWPMNLGHSPISNSLFHNSVVFH